MRSLIAVLALVAGLSFGGAFWMVYEGYSVDDRATPAAPAAMARIEPSPSRMAPP